MNLNHPLGGKADENGSKKILWGKFFADFPPRVAPIFDRTLKRIEDLQQQSKILQKLRPGAIVFPAVYASEGGLFLDQLLELAELDREDFERLVLGELSARCESLVKVRVMKNSFSLLAVGFVHMQARDAVARFFRLLLPRNLQQTHGKIADYFAVKYRKSSSARVVPEQSSLGKPQPQQRLLRRQCLSRLSSHLLLAKRGAALRDLLCAPEMDFCQAKCETGLLGEFLLDLRSATLTSFGEELGESSSFADWHAFFSQCAHVYDVTK